MSKLDDILSRVMKLEEVNTRQHQKASLVDELLRQGWTYTSLWWWPPARYKKVLGREFFEEKHAIEVMKFFLREGKLK